MAHIRILFFTFLWKVCRELFDLGVVYAALPPLYKIIKENDRFEYLADDETLEQYRNTHKGQKYEVFRFKGLGEMSQDETKILLDPTIRRWEQITAEDVEACDKLIQDLMGPDVEPRREYLLQHADLANIDV